MTGQSVSQVGNAEFQRVIKHYVNKSRQAVSQIIFKFTEIVEKRIQQELLITVGVLMYNRLKFGSVHYVECFGSCCVAAEERVGHHNVEHPSPAAHITGIVSLVQSSAEEHKEDDETTIFGPESHLYWFKYVLQFNCQEFHQLCICLIADNASVKLRI